MELVLGNIDRVEKTQEENGVNYDINVTNSSCYNDSSAMVSLTGLGLNGIDTLPPCT